MKNSLLRNMTMAFKANREYRNENEMMIGSSINALVR